MELPKEHAVVATASRSARRGWLENDEEALEVLPGIYDRVQAQTVGMFTGTPEWWRARRLRTRPGTPAVSRCAS